MIIDKCIELNRKIHENLFFSNYLSNPVDHKRVFTSLDVIEDCQNAIEEYKNIDEDHFQDRSTLYIYGVLQSLYCQQDGVFQLFRTIVNSNLNNVYELFEIYKLNKIIREVRDDIAGHPANRKNGKEFYYIEKGSNTKYKFTYAGFTPEFKYVNVDLKIFIEEQEKFIIKVLEDIESEIGNRILSIKEKFKGMKLKKYLDNLNHSLSDLYRGISSNNPNAFVGYAQINENIKNLKNDLNNRYNNDIPDSIICIFRLIDYILHKFDIWIKNNELYKNMDAEVFQDSLKNQIDELKGILIEIDSEFEE